MASELPSTTGPERVKPRRRKWRRRLIGLVVGIVVVVAAIGGGGWWYINYRLGQAHRVTIGKGLLDRATPGKPFTVLLIGSDSRQGESGSDATHFGSSSVVSGQRSDVIILARIVPATRQVLLLSIPRDLWVTIPGHVPYISGKNKINAAYNNGPSLLIETLKKNLGIPVDHFAAIDFTGFEDMVKAVGGIYIDFPDLLRDTESGLYVKHTGCQLVTPTEALAYVRSRHLYYYSGGEWNYDGLSDWSRIRRQDVFFRALLEQVKRKDTDLFAMNSLLDATVHSLTIDSTFTHGELISLALDFRHLSSGSLRTEVLPTIPETLPDGIDVLVPASRLDTEMVASFLKFGTTGAAATSSHAGKSSKAKGASTTTTAPTTTTTTTVPANVVLDTQPEPWNGAPCS